MKDTIKVDENLKRIQCQRFQESFNRLEACCQSHWVDNIRGHFLHDVGIASVHYMFLNNERGDSVLSIRPSHFQGHYAIASTFRS